MLTRMKRLAALALVLIATLPALAQKRAFSIEDFYRVKQISDLVLSRDGRSLAYVVATTDLTRAKRSARIWIMDADGGNARAVTNGDHDSAPQWSPDGKTIAFVRETDGVANLWLLPLVGGEARQLTKVSTGVSGPLWSPDGKWIAFTTDVYPKCADDDACNKHIADTWSNGKLKAHMADNGLLYRHWKTWKDGTITHTWVVSVDDGKARDVTPGPFDFPPFELGGPLQYDFSPDSTKLVVESNHDYLSPASSTNSDLWMISLTTPSSPENITSTNQAFDGPPKHSPDGRYIAYRMQKVPAYESDLFRIALFDLQS